MKSQRPLSASSDRNGDSPSRPGNVLVLGGYGHFGTRICRALARHGIARIWIAGRSRARASALATEINAVHEPQPARCVVLDLDDHQELKTALERITPDVIVHTAGPFQARNYSVAEICIEIGCHYVDLADGRRFVADFACLDQRARAKGVLLVSGASTLPGLSSAVVDLLRNRMVRVSSIEISIVPAGQTPRGEATIAAVMSYCGKPVRMLERGTWVDRPGWQDVRKLQFPQFARRVAVCDVPDLELFPRRYPGVETVSFRAGPESLLEHVALRGMAWAARSGIVSDWTRYRKSLTRLSRWVGRFGSDTGGMQVTVRGIGRDGETIERCWNLIAQSNHGPEIPCMPAIVLTRKLLDGRLSERGAMPCLGLIGLEDFAQEAQDFAIDWRLTRTI
jgi:saccharopine dehydrogenase-like NADP-dependent oxidoreductase